MTGADETQKDGVCDVGASLFRGCAVSSEKKSTDAAASVLLDDGSKCDDANGASVLDVDVNACVDVVESELLEARSEEAAAGASGLFAAGLSPSMALNASLFFAFGLLFAAAAESSC